MARRFLSMSLLCGSLLAALAGCGGSSTTASKTAASTPSSTTASVPAASVSVSTASVSKLGVVLVDGRGHTLYIFKPDQHAKVTCTGSCAQVWPPLKLESGQRATAGGQVKSSLLSTASDPEGGSVATYAGWPLYTYAGDSGPGTASGQGLNLNGGVWYVIAPTGTPTTTAP